jgi:hypothetical protein
MAEKLGKGQFLFFHVDNKQGFYSFSKHRRENCSWRSLFSFSKMVARIIRIVARKLLGPLFAWLLENLIGGHGNQKRRYF